LSRARSVATRTAAKIHSVLSAVAAIVVAKPLLYTRVVVSYALAMFGSVLPSIAAAGYWVGWS
jgi:hypothetical protein